MKNADMPVTPLVNDKGHPYHSTQIAFDNNPLTSGLTKREHFAGLAMQGILAGVLATKTPVPASQMAKDAVNDADALLKELEQ